LLEQAHCLFRTLIMGNGSKVSQRHDHDPLDERMTNWLARPMGMSS
jgi:hypothetical protein